MSALVQKWGWAAALALPLVGLGTSWAISHSAAQQGEEWLIPVQGYDPRDLLRGHYVQYRYDWPGEAASRQFDSVDEVMSDSNGFEYASAICIEGRAPHMLRASRLVEPSEPAAKPQRCAIIARETMGARAEFRRLEGGILYVSQTSARGLERKLADPKLQGLIRVRIRKDGVMRPLRLEFRPRPPAGR